MVFIFLILLVMFGTLGYALLLNIPFVDALYMTIITLSTVGFKEVAELNTTAKLFTIFIIVGGISTATYAITNLATFILEGEFSEIMRRKTMEKTIQNLHDHYILCGAGETGLSVIKRFRKSNASFVVIEKEEDKVTDLLADNVLVIHGDATHEETLDLAQIRSAKGMVTCLSNDADNVFVVLTAREMHPALHIVSRAIGNKAHIKLKRAGADNTISPNELGGTRMASLLLRPTVVSFLDIITHMGEVVLDLEEVTITETSSLIDMTLQEAHIPERTGLNVLAIKKERETKIRVNPGSQELIQSGDKLVVLGQVEQIEKLRKMIK